MSNHIVIVGGGIGGLCLAQGLKKGGISFSVYERDESPFARTQGFRLHIDPKGSRALHECLPADLYERFSSTCGRFGQGFTLMTSQLSEVLSLVGGVREVNPKSVDSHKSVHRMILRRILLEGLESDVHFGKRLTGFEEVDGKVTATFEDDSRAQGDLLIGADGVNSAVRAQYLPNSAPLETGVIALGGTIPLTDAVFALMPAQLLSGPVMVVPSQPASLFMALWKKEDDNLAQLGPLAEGLDIERLDDHIIVGYGSRYENYEFPKPIEEMTGQDFKAVLRRKVADWHPNLRKLVELLDPEGFGFTKIRTSEPVAPWPTTPVTLLGDAIHSMTPYRGIGANTALRDSSLLCKKLLEAESGAKPLLTAIAEYEAQMREYGFAAVRESRRSMEQMVSPKGAGFSVVKTLMRVVNSTPPVKRAIIEKMNA